MNEIEYSMGPQHAGTGHMRLKIHLSGDHVIQALPDPGYVHRGAEKLCETKEFLWNIPLLERVCLPDTTSAAWGYVLALERLLGVEPTESARYMRALFAEMNRIVSHLYWLAIFGIFLGHSTMFMWPFADREPFIELAEAISGARLTYTDIYPTGVRHGLPDNFVPRMMKVTKNFRSRLVDYERIFFTTDIFKQRTKEVGVLTKEEAIRLGTTGPVLRGSGVNYDLRKIDPYGPYSKLDFKTAVMDGGDSYSRAMVRLEEMRTSTSLIEQILEKMPSGEVGLRTPKKVPAGTAYTRVESARGELGYLVVSNGEKQPSRVKISTPCFRHLPALEFLLKDIDLADVPTIYWSLDYWPPNADR
ncbi:MAG: NADH-quinone oxidoreductase subunit D [Promethearchaeota archaeon]